MPLLKPSFGFYNQEEDSFTFPDSGESVMVAGDMGTAKYEMEGFEAERDLESMSAFLETCLGESSAMSGLWNMDFSSSGWM